METGDTIKNTLTNKQNCPRSVKRNRYVTICLYMIYWYRANVYHLLRRKCCVWKQNNKIKWCSNFIIALAQSAGTNILCGRHTWLTYTTRYIYKNWIITTKSIYIQQLNHGRKGKKNSNNWNWSECKCKRRNTHAHITCTVFANGFRLIYVQFKLTCLQTDAMHWNGMYEIETAD